MSHPWGALLTFGRTHEYLSFFSFLSCLSLSPLCSLALLLSSHLPSLLAYFPHVFVPSTVTTSVHLIGRLHRDFVQIFARVMVLNDGFGSEWSVHEQDDSTTAETRWVPTKTMRLRSQQWSSVGFNNLHRMPIQKKSLRFAQVGDS